jgi:hypothetical protein
MKKIAFALISAAAFFSTSAAFAQAKKPPQVFTLSEIVITARPTRPSAVVELGKILPEIEIAKIHKDFFTKIEEAISGEPF